MFKITTINETIRNLSKISYLNEFQRNTLKYQLFYVHSKNFVNGVKAKTFQQ